MLEHAPFSSTPLPHESAPTTTFQWLLVLGFPPDASAACLLRANPPAALQAPWITPHAGAN